MERTVPGEGDVRAVGEGSVDVGGVCDVDSEDLWEGGVFSGRGFRVWGLGLRVVWGSGDGTWVCKPPSRPRSPQSAPTLAV